MGSITVTEQFSVAKIVPLYIQDGRNLKILQNPYQTIDPIEPTLDERHPKTQRFRITKIVGHLKNLPTTSHPDI